jgi:sulfate permease, SulP family
VEIDEMGRVDGEKAAWGSVGNDPTRRTYRGVTVLRPDGPLFWANATSVVGRIEVGATQRQPLYAVVLDLEATNQMDTTTAERLDGLLTRLRAEGTDLYLVRVFGNVRDVLTKSGFLDALGPDHVWHSIAAGVKAARAARSAGVNPMHPFPDEDGTDPLDEPDELDEGAAERIASKAERSEASRRMPSADGTRHAPPEGDASRQG